MISKFAKPLACFRLAQHVGRQPPSSRPSLLLLRSAKPSQNHRYLSSTMPQSHGDDDIDLDYNGPQGDLFHGEKTLGPSLTGKTASIRRVFEAGSNAAGLLTCGGEQLARHASFDPNYARAQGWIRHHAVGPAVLSPVLIGGLVGALVEAVFPNSVPVSCSISHLKPLIVSYMEYIISIGNVNVGAWDGLLLTVCILWEFGSQSLRSRSNLTHFIVCLLLFVCYVFTGRRGSLCQNQSDIGGGRFQGCGRCFDKTKHLAK